MASYLMKPASLIAHMNGGTLRQEAERNPRATIRNRLNRARSIWPRNQTEARRIVEEARQVAALHKLRFKFVPPGRKN